MKKQEPKQSIALQRLSKSFIERLYEDGKIQEAFMAEHINQLYDYLSDKEEASNGECLECHRTSKVVDLDKGCPFCGTDKEDFITHSPQQEEYRGECICPKASWKGGITRIADCPIHGIHQGNPQLREESPKEDETPQADWVKEIDLELKEIHGDKFLTWMEYGWWIKKIRQILKHEITLAQQRTEKKWRAKIKKAIGTKEPKGKITGEWLNDVLECCKGERNLFRYKMSDLLK